MLTRIPTIAFCSYTVLLLLLATSVSAATADMPNAETDIVVGIVFVFLAIFALFRVASIFRKLPDGIPGKYSLTLAPVGAVSYKDFVAGTKGAMLTVSDDGKITGTWQDASQNNAQAISVTGSFRSASGAKMGKMSIAVFTLRLSDGAKGQCIIKHDISDGANIYLVSGTITLQGAKGAIAGTRIAE